MWWSSSARTNRIIPPFANYPGVAGIECEVRFYGGINTAAGGTERAKIAIKGATLGELLDEIKKRWPPVADYIDGSKSDSAILVLNEKALETPDITLKLKSGDILSIMPFVVGG